VTEPAVSVIIPTYNAPQFLVEAVDSVLAQTFRDFELIVVDDGSGPETRAALSPCMSKIRYVRQENAGIAGARNRGIAEARGRFIAFLDHDDLWLPEHLDRQLARARECPQAGVVYCDFVNFVDVPGERRDLGDPFARKAKPEGDVLAALFERNFVNTLVLLFRRECFEKVGGFDPGFKLILEYEMALRVAGEFDFARVPEVLSRYRLHGGNTSGGRSYTMTWERLRALEKVYANPGSRRVPRRVYRREIASVYLKLSELAHRLGRGKEARRHLLAAIRRRPFTLLRLKKIVHAFRKVKESDLYREAGSGESGPEPEQPPSRLEPPVAD
jgi:glycosyltransferase involved in cell wall biosynthesis